MATTHGNPYAAFHFIVSFGGTQSDGSEGAVAPSARIEATVDSTPVSFRGSLSIGVPDRREECPAVAQNWLRMRREAQARVIVGNWEGILMNRLRNRGTIV